MIIFNNVNRGAGVNNLFNNVQSKIIIYSFSTDKMIYFPAFVTDFSDAFTSNWNSTEVYGKMDPISTFKSTTRTINISFDIPNYSSDVVYNNSSLDNLITGLYPIYNKNDNGTSLMTSPPLFRIKFANLIENNGYRQKKDKISNTNDDPTLEKGLLGFFKSFDYKPDFTQGVYELEDKIFPKLIKVSLSFNVIHEHSLGNQRIGNQKSTRNDVNGPNTFPHRFDLDNEKLAPQPKAQAPAAPAALPAAKPPKAPGPGGLLEGTSSPEEIAAAFAGAGGLGNVSVESLLRPSADARIAALYDNPLAIVATATTDQLLNARVDYYNLPPNAREVGSRVASLSEERADPRVARLSLLDTPQPRRKNKGVSLRSSTVARTISLVGNLNIPKLPKLE